MKRCIVGLGIALLAPMLLDAGIFRSTAKKEYEQLKKMINTEGERFLGRIEKLDGTTTIFDAGWNDLVAKINAYSATYGGKVSADYDQQVAAFQKLIDQKRFQITGDDWNKLELQINILKRAIEKVEREQFTFRERRYALELYKALFEKLRDAVPQKALRGSINAFFGNGSFTAFAVPIIKKSNAWTTLRKQLRSAVPVENEEYEALLNDIERQLNKYNALYLEIKPTDRSAEDTIRAKDILRVLVKDIKTILEHNVDEPAFKAYGPILARIHSGLVAHIELGHK